MQYDEEMIRDISNSVDLLEYVGHSIDLKQRGKNYFGKCPLHSDLTPSFSITPDVNSFYCFSCGRGGGIIQFLVKYESLSYDAAVAKASHLASIDLKTMCQSQTVKLNRKIQRTRSSPQMQQHDVLDRRKFDIYKKGIVTEWLEEGIRQEELDIFEIRLDDRSNRIVYPVYDSNNQLINIKGRTRFLDFKKVGISKYMNYFEVGTMDYFQGANITLPFIKQSGEVMIFESIKSVMKLFGHGIKNSASAEKHSLTPQQIKLLIKWNVDVVFCYDSDVSYKEEEIQKNISILKKFTNVYIINDVNKLLGGTAAKNSPIDRGIEIWNQLYTQRQKIV